jgi:hypothetical protein
MKTITTEEKGIKKLEYHGTFEDNVVGKPEFSRSLSEASSHFAGYLSPELILMSIHCEATDARFSVSPEVAREMILRLRKAIDEFSKKYKP